MTRTLTRKLEEHRPDQKSRKLRDREKVIARKCLADNGIWTKPNSIVLESPRPTSTLKTVIADPTGELDLIAKELDYDVQNAWRATIKPMFEIDWPIVIVITTALPELLIPEDGVGGQSRSDSLIEIAYDPCRCSTWSLQEMITHEVCHAVRWHQNPEPVKDVYDAMILEGLAVYAEKQFSNLFHSRTHFLNEVLKTTNSENRKFIKSLKENDYWDQVTNLDDSGDFYRKYFCQNAGWKGYKAGLYLIKKYLSDTGTSFSTAVHEDYATIRQALDL